MIDLLIPFLFGLMVGAGGGVMIAALLVASRDASQPREAVRYVGGVIPDAEKATENLRRNMRKLYGTPVYETDARIGKWIVLTDKTVKCPKCGKCFDDAYDMDHADRFCRNCGECMEEDREGRRTNG